MKVVQNVVIGAYKYDRYDQIWSACIMSNVKVFVAQDGEQSVCPASLWAVQKVDIITHVTNLPGAIIECLPSSLATLFFHLYIF